MKYLAFSDLHGSAKGLELLRVAVEREKPDVVLCLGDILYGAYDSDVSGCLEYLASIRGRTLGVLGNCDFSFDGERIGISLPEERVLYVFTHRLFFRHVPFWKTFEPGDIALCGHTHVKELYEDRGVIHVNPGSIGKPRDGSYSYAILTKEGISLVDAETTETISFLAY